MFESIVIFIGIDVHKESYSYCSYLPSTQAFLYENTSKANNSSAISYIKRVLKEAKKETGEEYKACIGYEAGPTGFGLKRGLEKAGYDCKIMAPTTIAEERGGNRVKTDKNDARKLSKALCWGAYKEVVPLTERQEATRSILRVRNSAMTKLKKAKQQLKSFLLAKGVHYPGKNDTWTGAYIRWLRSFKFDLEDDQYAFEYYVSEVFQYIQKVEELDKKIEEISNRNEYKETVSRLRCFAGIDTHTALSSLVEIGDYQRFKKAKSFSAFLGLCPGEHSSGEKVVITGITKAGNSVMRKLLVESANSIARSNVYAKSKRLKARQSGMSQDVIAYADMGSKRIKNKMIKLKAHGKNNNVAKAACARELACFIWGMVTDNIYGEIIA